MIKVCIDPQGFPAKPQPSDAASISTRIANNSQLVSLSELTKAIAEGKTITMGAEYRNNQRSISNCLGIQVFAADIDEHNYSLSDLQEKLAGFDIPVSIIYESFSSTPSNRKWRLLFISQDVITEPALCMAILNKIAKYFDSDTAINEAARLLYGTTKDKIRLVQERFFFHATLSDLVIQAKEKKLAPNRKEVTKTKARSKKARQAQHFAAIELQNTSKPRYMSIFYATMALWNSAQFTNESIELNILNSIRFLARFADYDRSEEQIIDIIRSTINWLEKQPRS